MTAAKAIEILRRLSAVPERDEDWPAWLDVGRLAAALRTLTGGDWVVLYSALNNAFIHTVAVPAERVAEPDVTDLLGWNFNAHYNSWSTVVSFKPPAVRVEPPLAHTGTETLERGTKLVFPRAFEGHTGEKDYFELEQSFTHLAEIHYVAERQAWCRLDERGDVEDVVQIIHLERTATFGGGTVILCQRSCLDEWMAKTDCALAQTFELTRQGRAGVIPPDAYNDGVHADGDLMYRHRNDGDYAVFRGVLLIRTPITNVELAEESGRPGSRRPRQYETFVALDFRHGEIRDISTAPGAAANYFEESDLPFETSPAFFRPDVLTRYKADTEKYKIAHRSITCRGTWHLQSFDINEEGQVHAYICDLARLPYEEQQHWKAYNEPPKASISKRAYAADFKGEFTNEYDALGSLKHLLYEWDRRKVPWWTLRAENLSDRVHHPATKSVDEWFNELMNLHQFLVEGFEETWLRQWAKSLGRTPDPKVRSLKLLEECLMGCGCDEVRARAITAPLHQLNDLRMVKGHVAGSKADELKKAAIAEHRSYRNHFEAMVAACDTSAKTIDEVFTAQRDTA
jgi:hypothetical protein